MVHLLIGAQFDQAVRGKSCVGLLCSCWLMGWLGEGSQREAKRCLSRLMQRLLRGRRITYDLGRGRPSLAVHLSERGHDVWSLELRGHGRSQKDPFLPTVLAFFPGGNQAGGNWCAPPLPTVAPTHVPTVGAGTRPAETGARSPGGAHHAHLGAPADTCPRYGDGLTRRPDVARLQVADGVHRQRPPRRGQLRQKLHKCAEGARAPRAHLVLQADDSAGPETHGRAASVAGALCRAQHGWHHPLQVRAWPRPRPASSFGQMDTPHPWLQPHSQLAFRGRAVKGRRGDNTQPPGRSWLAFAMRNSEMFASIVTLGSALDHSKAPPASTPPPGRHRRGPSVGIAQRCGVVTRRAAGRRRSARRRSGTKSHPRT